MTALPDYLTEQKEERILARMLGRIPTDVDKAEGSYIWDALAPAAYELFLSAGWAQEVLRRGFATTTFGAYLDLRCGEHGVERRPAERATGKVTFAGASGVVVPAGTRVATAADAVTSTPSVEFETVETVTIGGVGLVEAGVTAVEAGVSGNIAAGAIAVLVEPVPGVTGIANAAAMSGGAETESDASLLERYLLKVRNPGTSGNRADYLQWALETDGVGGAQVHPLWNGPGTVKVYVLNQEKRAASAAIVAAVQDVIAPGTAGTGAGKAPIGASVVVAAPIELPIVIGVKLTLRVGWTLAQAVSGIQETLTAYLKSLAFADSVVRYSKVNSLLLDVPAIVDLSDLTMNGGISNVTVGIGQVAVPGAVNASV
ncbi:baseplate J/gp47 family protein [Cohnella ginsengisoli]|uniref:Baseplate J/gp47 family protein n=1 Tax=Cohnella ginsengisoli TaxID=425004 RepID=A0A9X4KJ63_9BACL|nr:baseplate J/gp47 family protein [Cohnella ginsengisoli]MDG0792766.1 baseplate J/gp47 family protein [Cohnella ginsengisoli]